MKKALLVSLGLLLFFSCQKKEAEKKEEVKKCTSDKPSGKKFEMYTLSEMAALMEQMYVENERVKEKITEGKPLGKFPEYYLKIHTAQFTDPSENDAFFKEKAALYITAQKQLYSDTNPANLKKNYNNGIDACLRCHENKCGGPIPKIKKLYLK